jgi:cellulose synthase/poly-beta-1,6-N-acetylglucosamine synthase-like glycosyltransferase
LTALWAALFWLSVLGLIYTYVAYPLIMYVRASSSPRRVRKRYRQVPVSVVLHGGGESWRDRLTAILDQDYPAALVDTVVLAEGHGGRAEVESLPHPRVRAVEFPETLELSEAVNSAVRSVKSDIVVFVGPTHRLSRNALAEVVAHFEDPEVGAVVGEIVVPKGSHRGKGEGVAPHSEYEKRILHWESEVDSAAGGDGSVFAVRRPLFTPLPAQAMHHDFLILMNVVRQGLRVVFMRSVRAVEVPSPAASDFWRRARAFAGTLEALAFEPGLLNPRTNRIFLQIVSHKLARVHAPYMLFAALASNVLLHGSFYRFTLILQALFHASALLHFTRLRSTRVGGVVRVSWTFAAHNLAAMVGFFVFLQSAPRMIWSRATNRVIGPSQGSEGSAAPGPPRTP